MGGGKYLNNYVRPYIVAAGATALAVLLYCWVANIPIWSEIKRIAIAAAWGSGWSGGAQNFGWLPAIGPIWFLLALFWACAFYAFISKHFNGIDKAIIVIGLFIFGIFSSRIISFPWSIQSGCCAVIYLYIGSLIKKYDLLSKHITWISVVVLICIVLLCVIGGGIAMNACSFAQGLISVIASVTVCIALFSLLKRTKFSGGWTGRNTLCLMCGNQIVDYLNYFYHAGDFFKHLTHFSVLNFLIEFLVCLFLSYLFGLFFYRSRLISH